VLAAVCLSSALPSTSAAVAVPLGGCARFALNGFAGVAAASDQTIVYGDVGGHNALTGFGPAPLPRVSDNSVYGYFQTPAPESDLCTADMTTAYNQAAAQPCTSLLANTDLAGVTLSPGVYCTTAGFLRLTTGSLTLSGDSNAVWVFQTATDVITSTKTQIILAGGASAANVFWVVGSSATLAGTSKFLGTILAHASIAIGTNAELLGRALAGTASVTLAGQDLIALPQFSPAAFTNGTAGFQDFTGPANGASTSMSAGTMGLLATGILSALMAAGFCL